MRPPSFECTGTLVAYHCTKKIISKYADEYRFKDQKVHCNTARVIVNMWRCVEVDHINRDKIM